MPSFKTRKPLPRGCATLLGFVLFLGGLAGLIVVYNTLYSTVSRIRAWDPVPCTVLRAETEVRGTDIDGNLSMDVNAELSWEYKGTRYTGGKLDADTGFRVAESVNAKEEICHRLRQEGPHTCYVNPDKPSEAILRLPEWWLVGVLSGLSFLVLGLGLMVILGSFAKRGEDGKPRSGCLAFGFVTALILVFLGGGIAIWWFGIRGATDWKAIGVRMKEVPCTVVASTVDVSGGGRTSSKTYRPKIYFRYEWDGRNWHSEWFNFNKSASGSSNRSQAQATVQRYPHGSSHSCWVDPEQPWVAVLEKSGARFAWLWIPAGLCLALGGFLLFMLLRKLLMKSGSGPHGSTTTSRPPPIPPPIPE